MAVVYICIAIGAGMFLVWIIIDYLNAATALKPKADMARQEISECEMRIESEQADTEATKMELDDLKQEIGDLEKELTEISKKVEDYRKRESRRKPTKFKLEE